MIAELRAAEAAANGWVEPLPGLTDAAMDGWEVPVPEHVRRVLRVTSGLRTLGPSGRVDEEFTVEHEANGDPGGPFYSRCGEPGTFRVLHTNGLAEAYYVDVAADTGEWNGVFSFWDSIDGRFEAPSLEDWFVILAKAARSAAFAVENGCFDSIRDAFFNVLWSDFTEKAGTTGHPEHDWSAWHDPALAPVVDAVTARASRDPVLAASGAHVPDSATVADLRGAVRRTLVPTLDLPGMGIDAAFRRFHGGRILAAVPWDD
ncbi:hypothetical protein O4J56_30450 [Nocardiopsis sp. RSe5-2]|uniref:SMI1/KNR4 family protein n=1 Tax=Nocardiopsis endophytica TaxID=3018445 RepID=A0ABT4UDD7_9ACTN|nr:hypothetical protein [Nocardiopsis endophytica]MDA2815005.1 hypothetical protein [Nocardiopsis endophytica]